MIRPHLLAILYAALAVSGCGTSKSQASDPPAPILDTARIEASRRNPFSGTRFFINPDYVAQVEQAAMLAPAEACDCIYQIAAALGEIYFSNNPCLPKPS